VTNPYPLVASNHFTRPVGTATSLNLVLLWTC
jgi:hypothetical protein